MEIQQKILRDAEKSLTEYTAYKTSARHCETFEPLCKYILSRVPGLDTLKVMKNKMNQEFFNAHIEDKWLFH